MPLDRDISRIVQSVTIPGEVMMMRGPTILVKVRELAVDGPHKVEKLDQAISSAAAFIPPIVSASRPIRSELTTYHGPGILANPLWVLLLQELVPLLRAPVIPPLRSRLLGSLDGLRCERKQDPPESQGILQGYAPLTGGLRELKGVEVDVAEVGGIRNEPLLQLPHRGLHGGGGVASESFPAVRPPLSLEYSHRRRLELVGQGEGGSIGEIEVDCLSKSHHPLDRDIIPVVVYERERGSRRRQDRERRQGKDREEISF